MHVYVCIQFKHVSICLCMYAVYVCFKVTRCACVRACVCVCTCNVFVRVVGLKRIVNLPSEYPDANTSCDIIKLAFLAMYYL